MIIITTMMDNITVVRQQHLHERITPLRGGVYNYFNPVTFSEMRGQLYKTVNCTNVLKGHFFHVLSFKIVYGLNLI